MAESSTAIHVTNPILGGQFCLHALKLLIEFFQHRALLQKFVEPILDCLSITAIGSGWIHRAESIALDGYADELIRQRLAGHSIAITLTDTRGHLDRKSV